MAILPPNQKWTAEEDRRLRILWEAAQMAEMAQPARDATQAAANIAAMSEAM